MMASSSGTFPLDVLDFADLVLPEEARVNWNDRRINEHLWHLANTVPSVHLDLINWQAGRFLAAFCLDLAELGCALKPVLRAEGRDSWIWRILSGIAVSAGLRRRVPDRDGFLQGVFSANSATPEAIAAFFAGHFYWP